MMRILPSGKDSHQLSKFYFAILVPLTVTVSATTTVTAVTIMTSVTSPAITTPSAATEINNWTWGIIRRRLIDHWRCDIGAKAKRIDTNYNIDVGTGSRGRCERESAEGKCEESFFHDYSLIFGRMAKFAMIGVEKF
jgi:hypothetical protein